MYRISFHVSVDVRYMSAEKFTKIENDNVNLWNSSPQKQRNDWLI